MRRRLIILTAVLALAPAALQAQQGDPEARMRAAVAAAARADIPAELVESKIQEGRAKGVPPARIAAAVEARLDALLRARTALASGGARDLRPGDLAVAADALQAGVSERAMVDVMTRVGVERRVVATAVLTELVGLGVASEVALARVHAAIAQGGEALVNLPAQASSRARGQGGAGVRLDVGPPAEVDAGVRGGVGRGRDRRND